MPDHLLNKNPLTDAITSKGYKVLSIVQYPDAVNVLIENRSERIYFRTSVLYGTSDYKIISVHHHHTGRTYLTPHAHVRQQPLLSDIIETAKSNLQDEKLIDNYDPNIDYI